MVLQPLDEPLAQFKSVFDAEGLQGALRFLNARTGYRYTAIYRLGGQMIQNIALYDRLGKTLVDLTEVPLSDSFCQFAIEVNGFNTTNSAVDNRVDGHIKQGIINSYFGLPLSRKPGTIYGTLCYFDDEPMELPDGEHALLEAVGPVLMDRLA